MFFGTCYHAGWLKHCEVGYIKASKKRLHAAVQLGWSKYSLNQLVMLPTWVRFFLFQAGPCERDQSCNLVLCTPGYWNSFRIFIWRKSCFGLWTAFKISNYQIQYKMSPDYSPTDTAKSRYMVHTYTYHISHTHIIISIYIHNYIYTVYII